MKEPDKMLKALQVCLPETEEESAIECDGCPYDSRFGCKGFVSLPVALENDIREYLKGVVKNDPQ